MSKGLLRSGITAAFDKDLWEALQVQPKAAYEIDNTIQMTLNLGVMKGSQGTPGLPAAITAEKDDDENIVLLVKVTNKADLFPKLNEVLNPDGNKSFSMSNKLLAWRYTAPTPAGDFDGAFEIEATGGFTGNLVHIHQHTGNVGSTRLLDVEAEDGDVTCIRVRHTVANALCAAIGDGLTIDKEGDLTTTGNIEGAEIKANKKLKYTIKRNLLGNIVWIIPAGISSATANAISVGVGVSNTQTAANTGWNAAKGTLNLNIYAYDLGTGVSMQGTETVKLNGVAKKVISTYCSGTTYCSGGATGSFTVMTKHAAPNKATVRAFIQNANAAAFYANASLGGVSMNDIDTVMLTRP